MRRGTVREERQRQKITWRGREGGRERKEIGDGKEGGFERERERERERSVG